LNIEYKETTVHKRVSHLCRMSKKSSKDIKISSLNSKFNFVCFAADTSFLCWFHPPVSQQALCSDSIGCF
jgi:hypothetical protein